MAHARLSSTAQFRFLTDDYFRTDGREVLTEKKRLF
jgi:hypothetical protein